MHINMYTNVYTASCGCVYVSYIIIVLPGYNPQDLATCLATSSVSLQRYYINCIGATGI